MFCFADVYFMFTLFCLFLVLVFSFEMDCVFERCLSCVDCFVPSYEITSCSDRITDDRRQGFEKKVFGIRIYFYDHFYHQLLLSTEF